MRRYVDTSAIQEAIKLVRRRTLRRLWITCATVITVWTVVIVLAG